MKYNKCDFCSKSVSGSCSIPCYREEYCEKAITAMREEMQADRDLEYKRISNRNTINKNINYNKNINKKTKR